MKGKSFRCDQESDGSQRWICSYVDDVFKNCISMPGGLTSQEANQRLFLNLQSFCNSWNYNNSCNGNHACFLAGTVGDNSCNGSGACQR